MESAIRKGRELPQWYLDEPQSCPMDVFYLRAFWDLNSTRRYEMGPVPWDIAVEYGHHVGLDGSIVDAFVAIIRAMDAAYLSWVAEQRRS